MAVLKKLETSGSKPSRRNSCVVVNLGQYIYLFGGLFDNFSAVTNTFYNDLYRLDINTYHWEKLSPKGQLPSVRGMSMGVDDKVNNRILLFGGVEYSADFTSVRMLNDLWAYSPDTNTWQEIQQKQPCPTPRAKSRLWLIKDKLYLFGGATVAPYGFEFLNDMWVYDLSANKWTEIIPKNQPGSPHPRDEAYAGLLPSSEGKLTIYGGEGALDPKTHRNLMLNDTWQFDIKTNQWTELTASIKENIFPPRGIGCAVTIGDDLYIHGGTLAGSGYTPKEACDAPFPQRAITNEIWRFNQVHHTWTHLGAAGDGSPRIKRHVACEAAGKMYLFSGFDYIWFGGTPEHQLFGNGPGQIWNEDVYCFDPKEK